MPSEKCIMLFKKSIDQVCIHKDPVVKEKKWGMIDYATSVLQKVEYPESFADLEQVEVKNCDEDVKLIRIKMQQHCNEITVEKSPHITAVLLSIRKLVKQYRTQCSAVG